LKAGTLDELIRAELEPDGVLVATIDMPGRSMNVFSADLMDALDDLMERVDSDAAVRSVVLTSGKSSFLAGADLVMVQGFCDAARHASHAEMFAMCGRLGRQLVRLEASAKPWVAAVNGLALGGGLELALACRMRLVADHPRIQLGLPEIRWGLLPGAGGTQRLPRLIGFAPAMDLLLSGRSLAPADAVRLGLFAGGWPAAQLLEESKAVARALHGSAYSEEAKFLLPTQVDVPAHSDATARTIAAQHGICDEQFNRYPAYSAIVDSVLKGARLPLAQATAVEMDQFLRLMFSPVAGRMVRTLFLERLRAERELGAPPDLRIERLGVGPIGVACSGWAPALARLKLPQVPDATLPAGMLELFDSQGGQHRFELSELDRAAGPIPAGRALAVLGPDGPYGRVLEIVGSTDAEAAALASLAARMGCLPWRTAGPASVLQRLHGLPIEKQAEVALQHVARPRSGDPAFLDVAACLAGVTPAWTGGPLTWAQAAMEATRQET
jgi:3-hydroxyacyl-CoA dehydrogenase/enoyl-CoA hydratase/3-hydroxybutyryl-CoA epimerase